MCKEGVETSTMVWGWVSRESNRVHERWMHIMCILIAVQILKAVHGPPTPPHLLQPYRRAGVEGRTRFSGPQPRHRRRIPLMPSLPRQQRFRSVGPPPA